MRFPLAIALVVLAIAAGYLGGQLRTTPATAAPADARIADVVQQLKYLDKDVRLLRAHIDKFGPEFRMSLHDQLGSICADIHYQVWGSSTSCR